MKQKDAFRFTEKCLYDYKTNLACIQVLKEDLKIEEEEGSSVHAQNYQLTFGFSGEPSNPVHDRLMKLEGLKERIKILERWTRPITQLLKDLDAPENLDDSDNKILLEIFKYMYIGKNKMKSVADELNLSERGFARLRRKLVYTAASYLGV